jgi:hypothetical protein
MTIPYNIRKMWDEIRWWWNPRQKWLIKKIPNHWIDKDYLWEICILEGIKHYVEKDGGLDHYESSQNDPSYPEWQKTFDKELKNVYNEITMSLPSLEKQLEDVWKKVPHFDFNEKVDYNTVYGEVDRIEKKIADLKTDIMVWAVTNREKIWT